MYKCELCEYESNNKSNLNRHHTLMHSETIPRHLCSKCDCTYTTLSNLRRHMMTKHKNDLVPELVESNATIPEPSIIVPPPINADVDTVSDESGKLECEKCKKTFAKKYNLKQHFQRCKGVTNPLECQKCHKVFTNSGNKSRHTRVCQKDLQETSPSITTQTADTINNIQNQQNIQTQHNGDNNTTVNVNIVNFSNAEPIQFIVDSVKIETLRQALMTRDKPDDVLIEFAKMLLNVPENLCVEKTSIRSDYSSVHIGNGEWETKSDEVVYPKLVSDIASSASDYFHSNKKALTSSRHRFDEQQRLHDYMADNGYCADDARAVDVRRKYRKVIRETKAITFNQTRKKKKTCGLINPS